MLKGIDINELIEFTSSKDVEPKTVFCIGNISHKDKLRLFTNENTMSQEKIFDVLKVCVKKIKNLNGADYDVVTDEVLEKIPFEVFAELIEKVVEFNRIGEVERKN